MAKFPSDMPEKTAPVDNDFVLLADSQDNDEVKKVRVSKISASSVIDDLTCQEVRLILRLKL